MPERMEWKISVPIFRNALILKQLGIALGIPFGILTVFLALTAGAEARYALGMITALLILTGLLIMLVYRGNYNAEFVLDEKSVLCRTQARQAKKNRVVNTLTVLLGLLSGRPAVAGAGMLADSRQSVQLRWKNVTRVKYLPRQHTIQLRAGWTENIALFCTDENYEKAARFVMSRTGHLSERQPQ